jgi:transposase
MSLINFGFTNRAGTNSAMVTIPLDLPDVRVLKTEINDQGEIIITVESTIEGTTCKHCGEKIGAFHQRDEWIAVRHFPTSGSPDLYPYAPEAIQLSSLRPAKGEEKGDYNAAVGVVSSQKSSHTTV